MPTTTTVPASNDAMRIEKLLLQYVTIFGPRTGMRVGV
jgi:hypothetical protein